MYQLTKHTLAESSCENVQPEERYCTFSPLPLSVPTAKIRHTKKVCGLQDSGSHRLHRAAGKGNHVVLLYVLCLGKKSKTGTWRQTMACL